MSTPAETLEKISEMNGHMGSCIVDSDSGMMLASQGGGVDLELAAAGNTEVVRAKRSTMKSLGISESIADILITLDTQYHLIRPVAGKSALFIYVVLDKGRANLAMARHLLTSAEEGLAI